MPSLRSKLSLLVSSVVAATLLSAAPAGAQRVPKAKPSAASKQKAAQRTRSKTRSVRVKKGVNARQIRRLAKGSDKAAYANALRRRADKMARVVARAKTNKHARRYVKTKYKRDVRNLLAAMHKIQRSGKIDAKTEIRAMAAAGRILHAAAQFDTTLVSDQERDSYDRLISNATYRRKAPHHETAVEIETRMTEKILDAITTRDGTVKSILDEGGKPAPEFLTKKAGSGNVKAIKWDSLSRAEKMELLRSQSKGRDFFSNRSIPGVQFRREIAKPTGVTVSLGGNTAGPDKNKIDHGGILMNKVEYMGPKNVDTVSGIEMHVRQRGRASRNSNEAFRVAGILDSPAKAGHEHIPHRVPSGVLRDNAIDRAGLVDFYRRANVTAELKAIKDGYLIKPVRDGNVVYFDFLQSQGLAQLNDHLHTLAKTGKGTLGKSTLKMGAVGFRPGELYGDGKMFGFEVRTLHKADKTREKFVDAVQKGILTGRYGLKRSTMKKWHKTALGKASRNSSDFVSRQSKALSKLHYNRSVSDLLADASPDLSPALTDKVKQRLNKEANDNYGLKMLVHDWSKDPALAGNKAVQKQVLSAQKAALKTLGEGGDATLIIKNFANTSGLYKQMAKSIGMTQRPVTE